jgi:plastocyanin
MDTLDSRLLGPTDCFGRRFAVPGIVRYTITRTPSPCLSAGESEFTIEVTDEKSPSGEPQQLDVSVRVEEGRLVADPPRARIGVGDFVVWSSAEGSMNGYALHGEYEGDPFGSTLLTSETLFSHAFGQPGDYEWTDAAGRGPSGRVVVRELDWNEPKNCEAWTTALTKGTVVVVEGDRAEPQEVEILIGQTVFWAIAKSDGLTVTDTRVASPVFVGGGREGAAGS